MLKKRTAMISILTAALVALSSANAFASVMDVGTETDQTNEDRIK